MSMERDDADSHINDFGLLRGGVGAEDCCGHKIIGVHVQTFLQNTCFS